MGSTPIPGTYFFSSISCDGCYTLTVALVSENSHMVIRSTNFITLLSGSLILCLGSVGSRFEVLIHFDKGIFQFFSLYPLFALAAFLAITISFLITKLSLKLTFINIEITKVRPDVLITPDICATKKSEEEVEFEMGLP